MPEQIQEINITRTIQSLPSKVYAAFTTAEGWLSWCSEKAECDAQVGGKLHIYTEGYHAFGEFKKLEPGRTAVFTWDGDNEPPMLVKVILNAQDHSTLLTFQVIGLCSAYEWEAIAITIEQIWSRVLNNLKEVLED